MLCAETADNEGMQLVFALSYGGRAEIVDAARRLARDAELGKIDPEGLDEKGFSSYLYAADIPDPDLLDPNRRRTTRLEFPALADRVFRAAYERSECGPSFGVRNSNRRSSTTNAASVVSG